MKEKEKDGKETQYIDESQSIQVTPSSNFIENDGKEIACTRLVKRAQVAGFHSLQSRRSGDLGIPVPIIASTILLNLANMEYFILSGLGKLESKGFGDAQDMVLQLDSRQH